MHFITQKNREHTNLTNASGRLLTQVFFSEADIYSTPPLKVNTASSNSSESSLRCNGSHAQRLCIFSTGPYTALSLPWHCNTANPEPTHMHTHTYTHKAQWEIFYGFYWTPMFMSMRIRVLCVWVWVWVCVPDQNDSLVAGPVPNSSAIRCWELKWLN